MTLEEAIERYTSNAEYERTHGNLQGCLEFRQLAEWLKDYKRLLEQQPYDFAKWVASEIFDEWEYNKDTFAEIACRKLAKLGIVRAKGDEWELVEQEPTCDTCEYTTAAFNPCNACKDKSEYKPMERSDKE